MVCITCNLMAYSTISAILCTYNYVTEMVQNPHFLCVHMPHSAPSQPPHNLQRVPLNSTTLRLSWQPPLSQYQNGIIREYRINITENETRRNFQLTSTHTFIIIPHLHPYYRYNCSVAAYTVSLGPFSSVITVNMPENGNKFILYYTNAICYVVAWAAHEVQCTLCTICSSKWPST